MQPLLSESKLHEVLHFEAVICVQSRGGRFWSGQVKCSRLNPITCVPLHNQHICALIKPRGWKEKKKISPGLIGRVWWNHSWKHGAEKFGGYPRDWDGRPFVEGKQLRRKRRCYTGGNTHNCPQRPPDLDMSSIWVIGCGRLKIVL